MKSKASVFGHPLHTILVALPIGLAIWALLSDVIYAVSDNMTWYDMAMWTGIGFAVTAVIAALPGFVDYLTVAIKSDSRNMATVHMLSNLIVVALFIVAAALAWDEAATAGGRLTAVIVLHAAGVGLLALSGWLGGEMVYRRHIGVIPDDGEVEAAEQRRHHIPAVGRR